MKRLAALAITLTIIAANMPLSKADWTWAKIIDSVETQVAPEATYSKFDAENGAGRQSVNALEFNPLNEYTRLRAGKTYGKVYGVQTVSAIANSMEKTFPGQVVAAVNGDYFDLGYGAPFGVYVDEGEILSSPPNYYCAFGIKNDGTPFIIKHGAILDRAVYINDKPYTLTGINNRHKDLNSFIAYLESYAETTKTGSDTYEVVCDILSGEPRHGETLVLRVADLRDGIGNTPIGAGRLVLSAKGSYIDTLKTLVIGQEIKLWLKFNDFWSDVRFAVGGNSVILKDREIYDVPDTSKQPRTVVGIKADGNVVFATIDGRQSGVSEGVSMRQAAEMLRDMGCVDALNLDGGGSTAFVLRPPGETSRKLVNIPSGGTERQVANALVLLNTAEAEYADRLIVNPYGRKVLTGGRYTYKVTGAVDENFQPVPLETGSFYWTCDTDLAEITQEGVLTPRTPGFVTVTADDGYIYGSTVTEIVSDITGIKSSVDSLSVLPGAIVDIPVTAYRGKQKIESTPEAFDWAVTNDAGSFIEPGKFKAADTAINGEIIVSFNDISLAIPIETYKEPALITDFETDSVSFTGVGVASKMPPAWKFETDRDYIMFGNRTLKMYYNFLNTQTDVGSYLMVNNENPLMLNEYPKKLGMWVYGDGSGVHLRSILEDIDKKQATVVYTDINGINWKGWKYVEAAVPAYLRLPIFVKVPVYLASNGDNRTHGSLYFDNLRAVFSKVSGEDYEAPALVKAWPDSGMIISTRLPAIGVILTDNSKTSNDAGIDPASIELIVNGYTCKDAVYNPETGKISYQVKNKLKNGWHSLKVRARDRFGNPFVREWYFIVRV